jgi:iron complex outermembrane recepter protein
VFRGPSSSLFGNYATGGAINFRTRPGGDINGIEYGIDAGSFGYLNNYLTGGAKAGNAEVSIFTSDVRGDGYIGNGDYDTQTVNALLTFKPTGQDTVTLKVIHNELQTHLPIRQSLGQFYTNPFQAGCATAGPPLTAGCGTITVNNNGFNTAAGTKALTAAQAGLGRDDTRTILAARWEHAFDPLTVWRTQLVRDDRDISQPTGATSAIGDFTSWNLSTGLTKRTELFGLEATHFVGVHYNVLPSDSFTYGVIEGGNARLGRLTNETKGITSNFGFNLREELKLDPRWTLAAGIMVEQTHIKGLNTAYTYTGAAGVTTTANVSASRDFYNMAPEASLTYRHDDTLQVRGRVSTGYGTPQIGNLFVTPDGKDGNNTNLTPQTNIGYDLGVVWAPNQAFKIDVTGFYEFFEDELVTQSPGINLKSFTFNAPASEHRGVEIAATVKPVAGVTLTAAYLYDDQYYTQYTEQITNGAKTSKFDRAGNKIPGVAPNELLARIGYDLPSGPLKGLGVYAEYQWRDAFFMDNGNILTAGPSETVNLNVHYTAAFQSGLVRQLTAYFEVHNILDRTNIASANNISNSINAATGLQNGAGTLINSTGSIYAAEPRTYYGGVKLKF